MNNGYKVKNSSFSTAFRIRKDKCLINKTEQIKNKIKVNQFLKKRERIIKASTVNYDFYDFDKYSNTMYMLRNIARGGVKEGSPVGTVIKIIARLQAKMMGIDEDLVDNYIDGTIYDKVKKEQAEKREKQR